MSRYPPPDFRGPPRDRSRSPPRFADRRASTASIYDARPAGPPRTASDAPRGPRSQFDGARPPLNSSAAPSGTSRPTYGALRDAPPLGSGDRGRSYRDREYERRDRPPSPRERSPPRTFKDTRDYPLRDLEIPRTRRDSRDGPPSAGSTYSDGQPFAASAASRGNFSRGRGRGDYSFKGGRGGRGNADERDLFRRDRSPPLPRWGRDPPREERETERRDDRRYERREDDRRQPDWNDRERERELDRGRRDQPGSRIESRPSSESVPSATVYQSSQQPPVNPQRLALIESSGPDTHSRRPSIQQDTPPVRDGRRDQPETPAYLNGRAETTANRYASRGSSPPAQAPPVPAFSLSFAPPPVSSNTSSHPNPSTLTVKSPAEHTSNDTKDAHPKPAEERKPDPPPEAPTAPRLPPTAPKAQLVSPPPAAPRAPRALELEDPAAANGRLQGVRSLENLSGSIKNTHGFSRTEPTAPPRPTSMSTSPATASALPTLIEPVSPDTRFAELNAPTGPRAARMSPAQPSVSPRPPYASPRSDIGGPPGLPRVQTPPPSAPSGPRNRSFSVSPKVATSTVPTAPRAIRAPPLAPRALERGPMQTNRAPDRLGAPPSWAPPSAPRSQQQWNQWRRPGVQPYADQTIPAKRDITGEEKTKSVEQGPSVTSADNDNSALVKVEDRPARSAEMPTMRQDHRVSHEMEVDREPPRRHSSLISGHSAAQSFFGKPDSGDDEDSTTSDTPQDLPSSSEDDDSDLENDLTLFNAKFERQKRQLEAEMVDLSTRFFRATTPLESIARLARISGQDLQKFKEQRENDMDLDRSPVRHKHHVLPQTRRSSDSGEGPDIPTPRGEDDHRVAIRSSDGSSDGVRRVRRPSPEPVNLPYLLKDGHKPWSEDETFNGVTEGHEDSKAAVEEAIEDDMQVELEDEDYVLTNFAHEYRKWREECQELDRLKEEEERLERQQSLDPGPEADVTALAPLQPMFESRRLHKHSSEYEIEQVLKQSEETARIEQERQDREARKNQADMEKEARIPDQLTEEEIRLSVFIDSNRYRDPESLTRVFSYEPPVDDFTEHEQQIFIAAYKETPKKWGEIASLLPGRNYEDCIRHYYANKWDGRFRDNRTKKLKAGGRRGRGGGRGPRGRMGGLMADLARVEDFLPENMSDKGRPRRAAAPTTFAEKEAEAKANLLGAPSAKKPGPGGKAESVGDTEKPVKRQKRTGEKPGRKANKAAGGQLAALAAAPQGSPGKQLLQGMHTKEDLDQPTVLASIHSGHQGVPGAEMAYSQEGYMPQMPPPEEPDRSKAAAPAPTKQGASSYWSVPEQSDFAKYISHFGRDFAAIAAHMGTKTQTMIKNHYVRQVDGGNNLELEKAANEAEDRKARGEDMGPPPTPTPIQKRKYENPPAPAQRTLAPHGDSAEVDEGAIQRIQQPKHTSPPQYQPQPRSTTAAQNFATPASRVGPNPLTTASTPVNPVPATAHSRPMQHPSGGRFSFLSDTRNEPLATMQSARGYGVSQESPTRGQATQQGRAVPDPEFLRNLAQEQDRARRILQFKHHERAEQHPIQAPLQGNPPHGSPVHQPLHNPPDRKPIVEDRPQSPPRNAFAASNLGSRPPLGAFGSLTGTGFPPLGHRPGFNPSPPKREDPRPGSMSSAPPPHPAVTSAPPPEPKRSNVMSLLNSEPEETKSIPKESAPSAPHRTASPAQQGFPPTTSGTPLSSITTMRRPSFGQPSIPQSHFHRSSFGQQGSNQPPGPHNIKHEPLSAGGSLSQSAKPDWAARVLGQTSQPSPPTPTLDRERPYHAHRSLLGPLGQPRFNPSPPPLGTNPHSRTPSLSEPNRHLLEQQRPSLGVHQQPSSQQPAQPLQPNPYGHHPSTFSQQQPNQVQNQSHHAHNASLGGPFPSIHHRALSRDGHLRRDPAPTAQRERDEPDFRWRRDALDPDRRRDPIGLERPNAELLGQRHQEQERERQQNLHRAPPQPLQPPPFGATSFNHSGSMDLRGQALQDAEMAMREHERQRMQQDADRRRHESLAQERESDDLLRRRREDALFRRTPLGGSFGVPPPGPPRR